eukprot:s886_g9.t1
MQEPVVHEAIEPECFAQLAGKPSALQDNIYSLLAASVVHEPRLLGGSGDLASEDTVRLKTGTLGPTSRMLRCGSSALLVVFCIGIQIFLLQCLYLQFVRRAVVDIRKLYSNFEHHMYTQTEVYESDAVTVRGLPGYLMESQIKNLGPQTFSQSELERICDIPLANWRFLAAILLVWTLEILVNGVALEFVISLESILYAVVVSGRNKLMVDPELQRDAALCFLC